MNQQTIQVLQSILEALMTVSVKGNDAVTMVNCMQTLQKVIQVESARPAQPIVEPESAE